eukprot:TRINITY_DN127392_c0_g1_i1.p1 TRINITY_DN127392_c0_g1~~TRINITY_DN127392_c0_g1_i1.p1  ORF type:complete len:127 (+),score=35.63 TRINITY_DN127392_c0_g1_i1:89-469(+)
MRLFVAVSAFLALCASVVESETVNLSSSQAQTSEHIPLGDEDDLDFAAGSVLGLQRGYAVYSKGAMVKQKGNLMRRQKNGKLGAPTAATDDLHLHNGFNVNAAGEAEAMEPALQESLAAAVAGASA